MVIFNSYVSLPEGTVYPMFKPPRRSSVVGQDDMRIFSLQPDVANIANPESGDEGLSSHVFQDQMGRSWVGLQVSNIFLRYMICWKNLYV